MEQWKRVDGFLEYEVSTEGRLRRVYYHCTKYLNPAVSGGYNIVRLSKNGKAKSFLLHTLVLTTFVGREEGKNWANHKNGNSLDNRLENLEWSTRAQINTVRQSTGRHKGMSHLFKYMKVDKDKRIISVCDSPKDVLKKHNLLYHKLQYAVKNDWVDAEGCRWLKIRKDEQHLYEK